MVIMHEMQIFLISHDNYFLINICAIFYVFDLIQHATTDQDNSAN